MKESIRQMAIFVVILAAGSVLVLFDIPFVYLVAGIVILCVLVLILAGAVKIRIPRRSTKKEKGKGKDEVPAMATAGKATGTGNPESGKSRILSPPNDPGQKEDRTKPKGSKSTRTSGIKLIGDAIREGFHIFVSDLSRAKKKQAPKVVASERAKGTESLRDADVETVPAIKRVVEDPFRDLVKEEGDTELLNRATAPENVNFAPFDGMEGLDGLDLPTGEDIAHADLSSAEENPQLTIDEETDDEVAEILESHKEELDPGSPGPELSGLDELDSLDLGSIDLDEGIDLEGENAPQMVPSAVSPESASVASKPPQTGSGTSQPSASVEKPTPFSMSDMKNSASPGKVTTEQESMLSFASGSGGDDDLISSLRTEVSQTKRKTNESLLRELKDTRVPASDLAKELESVFGPQDKSTPPAVAKRTRK